MSEAISSERPACCAENATGHDLEKHHREVSPYFQWKGWIDRGVALLLLIPGLPMMGFLIVLVRCTSKGPAIYRQIRVGKHGRTFVMYKIRTMREDAEAVSGPVWTTKGDPRVTLLGRFLRAVHMDELPQLFNVLRGEMSLMGPRPERPEFVQKLTREIPHYAERLQILPGISGLAQINLPPDTDLDSVRRKLLLDLEYVRTASLAFDIRMFLCTCARLVGIKGETAIRMFWLRRCVTEEDIQRFRRPTLSRVNSQSVPRVVEGKRAGVASAGTNGSHISRHRNVFTVDVEDYFQVSAFEGHIHRDSWGKYESRVEANTRRILRLLDKHDIQGTFFILGWVADKCPDLVREIHSRGHEIGSHSYWHRLIYEQSPEEFREDLRRSRDVLEEIVAEPIHAFRAPSFSITRESLWALEILMEEGFRYDSSIFPVHHDRYGIPDAETSLHRIETNGSWIWEFPASVLPIGNINLPTAGGGYFRLYPVSLTQRCLKQINSEHDRPFIFYTHPWEIDPDQPRLSVGTRKSRFRHYVNLASTYDKLDAVLQKFRFGPMKEVIAQYGEHSLTIPLMTAAEPVA